jgi:hypothetical protein
MRRNIAPNWQKNKAHEKISRASVCSDALSIPFLRIFCTTSIFF